jgi:hypothetical protein
MSDVPLPTPFHGFYGAPMYSADQLHAYAAAVSAAENARLRGALELIAAPMRPDGTWNRERLACQQIAVAALKGSQP